MICNKCKKDVMATIHDLCIECHDDIPRDPIVESVIAKYQKRSAEGMIKYGVTMMRDDLSTIDWLNHLQEELMDATLYLQRLRVKLESKATNDYDQMQDIYVKKPKPGDQFIYGETWDDHHDKLSEQGYFDNTNDNDAT